MLTVDHPVGMGGDLQFCMLNLLQAFAVLQLIAGHCICLKALQVYFLLPYIALAAEFPHQRSSTPEEIEARQSCAGQ